MYAIIDIETTGGNAKTGKITEIAIFLHDGERITESFSTLIDPESNIPRYITNLTGIDDEMVAGAPKFYEVAKRIVELTEGRIFVGHNVLFDYSFIKSEFASLGYEYKRRTLCTVRLARKLLPGMKSYSLGKLCRSLGISLDNHHRASADARATVTLLEMLIAEDRKHNEQSLTDPYASLVSANSLLTHKMIYQLPELTGVYQFFDEQDNLIYIGKSTNIRQRILSHFRSTETRRAQEMKEEISRIDYTITGSELVALLMESQLIKERKPKFNRAQRRSITGAGLYAEYNWEGYIEFSVQSTSKQGQPLTTFRSKEAGKNLLFQWIEEYGLCQKLCGLYHTSGACFHHALNQCKGACIGQEDTGSYNKRANKLIEKFRHQHDSFIVLDKGRDDQERSVIMVENGKYLGFGFTDQPTEELGNGSIVKDAIRPCINTRFAHQVIKRFLSSNEDLQVIPT